jgi:hypothetical protein
MDLAPALLLGPNRVDLSKADGVVDDRRTSKQPSDLTVCLVLCNLLALVDSSCKRGW